MSSDIFYNKLELISPPLLSFKFCCKNPETASKQMNEVLGKAINELKTLNTLHNESAMLSRLIYRWKWRLRNDKGFKALEKVNRSLLQYLALDMLSILESARQKVYEEYGPSKQVIEWVLVRLQGFSKLFDNICQRCIDATTYLQWRFQNGHLWNAALIGTAVISRIWVISVYLMKESCDWYSKLKQMLPVLQPGLQPWLPANYKLPDDLTAWLGHPDYSEKSETMKTMLFELFNKDGPGDVHEKNENVETKEFQDFLSFNCKKETCIEDIGEVITKIEDSVHKGTQSIQSENTVCTKNDSNGFSVPLTNGEHSTKIIPPRSTKVKKKRNKKIPIRTIDSSMDDDDDVNVVSNEFGNRIVLTKVLKDGTISVKKRKKKNKILVNTSDSDVDHIDSITTRAKLIRFVKREQELRKTNCQDSKLSCLTYNMDKLQWRMFQKFIKERIEEMDENPNRKKKILRHLKQDIRKWIS